MPTPAQHKAILDAPGHEPCPGVEIEFQVPLGHATVNGPALHATVFRPTRRPATPAPALLAFHGGGWISSNPNGCGALAKHLALTLGVTTVSASYRLAAADRPIFPGLLDDARHAFRWILAQARELDVDPTRIAVSGESAGVLLASHLALNSPWINLRTDEPRPAALIAQWGPVDFVARWFDRGESPGAEKAMLGAGYDENPALYHHASPLTHVPSSPAARELPPALLIYGRQDPIVHARQGRLAHAAWRAAGAPSELLILNQIGHCTEGDNRPQRAQLLQAASAFLAARMG